MPPKTPPDIGRAINEVRAQRKAEQNALFNVRKELDQLEAQDARQRKLNRILVIVAAIVLPLLLIAAWLLMLKRAEPQDRNAAPVQIPSKVDMSKKPEPKPAVK